MLATEHNEVDLTQVNRGQHRSTQVNTHERGVTIHGVRLSSCARRCQPLYPALSASHTDMSAPPAFVPITELTADSSTLDICRAVLDLHTFHSHKQFFAHSDRWRKVYRCIVQFSVDRHYGQGHLAVAYLHYRQRTLYRLCGVGSPHPEERPDMSREKKKKATKRRRQGGECAARQEGAISSFTSAPPQVETPLMDPSAISRYHDAHAETQSLDALFRLYTQRCNPLHGADFVMGHLPEKRSRRSPSPSGVVTLPEVDRSVPAAVAHGYAECTRKAFDKMCEWLCEAAPPALRMGAGSVFLDVGSGYGKCVVQARLRADVRKSIGIEYVAVRYAMGWKMLTECIPSQFALIHARLGGCVELLQGDATDEQFVKQYEMATHIYLFDWVFNDSGKEGVRKLIERSQNLCVLVTCQRPERMRHFRKLHQMQLSTGRQRPTVYFYARSKGVCLEPSGLV